MSYSHWYVTHDGVPCVLYAGGILPDKGVLIPVVDGERQTDFICQRVPERANYGSIYARRRAASAAQRTRRFILKFNNTMIDQHPTVARILACKGEWKVVPCQKKSMTQLRLECLRAHGLM